MARLGLADGTEYRQQAVVAIALQLGEAALALLNRCAGDHVAYFWTFTGTHAATRNPLRIVGWEEWDLNADLKVIASKGWFDAAEYEHQTKGQ